MGSDSELGSPGEDGEDECRDKDEDRNEGEGEGRRGWMWVGTRRVERRWIGESKGKDESVECGWEDCGR